MEGRERPQSPANARRRLASFRAAFFARWGGGPARAPPPTPPPPVPPIGRSRRVTRPLAKAAGWQSRPDERPQARAARQIKKSLGPRARAPKTRSTSYYLELPHSPYNTHPSPRRLRQQARLRLRGQGAVHQARVLGQGDVPHCRLPPVVDVVHGGVLEVSERERERESILRGWNGVHCVYSGADAEGAEEG